ncbi:hypothetical protein O181_045829 [Austropuccinia psidii MF-1]|uniref:Uncharacterized protein n=1 Tax=Austropuccinia psidii MF-1 TaxID=1389203 RepID=A0A9Q3DMY0_9BASI|nr:hypothetical protein [Austropuccinia psidii MF-1]
MPPHSLPSLRLRIALTALLTILMLTEFPPDMLPTPLILMLVALLTCLRHSLPSLRLQSALPTCSRHCLPSLCLRSALPTCSRHCLPSLRFRITSTVYGGLLAYMMTAIAEIC